MFMVLKFFSLTLQLCVIRLIYVNSVNTSRSSRPTDVLWPCHALLGSPACLRKYLAVLKLLTKYVFADP